MYILLYTFTKSHLINNGQSVCIGGKIYLVIYLFILIFVMK